MKWSAEAEKALKKVPFFVRKKVRARVEKEASSEEKKIVTLADVKATKARYLSNMEEEIRGYQVDVCFGQSGCPNRVMSTDQLQKKIEAFLEKEDFLGFLKQIVQKKLRFHHEFRVGLADCPNACSQPQIKDIGIIGAIKPAITKKACTICNACVDICKENAIQIDPVEEMPVIDHPLCLACGKCIEVCPTGTIAAGKKGFRVQLGGKLGRHPKLARELPGLFGEEEVLEIVSSCTAYTKKNSRNGERFADIVENFDFLTLPGLK